MTHHTAPFTIPCHHVAPTVVLATAFVPINDIDGQPSELRALLDSGSSVSFISERAVRKLRLVRQSCQLQVSTVGDKHPQSVNGCVRLGMNGKGEKSEVVFSVDALILNRVVGILPPTKLSADMGSYASKLADSSWGIPGAIDLLLGADVYHTIVSGRHVLLGPLTLIETIFGYAVSGPLGGVESRQLVTTAAAQVSTFDIAKFWTLE